MTRGVRRGCVRLRAAVIGIDDEDDSTFTITVDHKTFHFQVMFEFQLYVIWILDRFLLVKKVIVIRAILRQESTKSFIIGIID